ncbi:HlyD family secretion protein [Alicyclobacillus sp. ALC3]|uniref:HlyD family secretion protein n=1 Tax=Alicyclobacillus sp. ALC3 TaxID=2796143 RepID=UPI0023796957|nr:efflux RND transporter periplasmic adaptor subunit [Alicyclobacillus sp. ALC3]WDL96294.1 efflux RND transporter periplasmic adaptor subunit [Alicyclobacillus sp. ALC3]
MRARQLVLVNILIILVVAALVAGGYWYFYNQNNYIHVSDATVTVQSQDVVATATGKLTEWTLQDGTSVSAGQVIGVETLPTGQKLNITVPHGGQVLKSAAVPDEVVSAGTLLAVVGNLNQEYIRANVKETEIRHVAVGQTVDIALDAYPGTTFTGTVTQIGEQTAAQTSPFPSAQSSGNFTKVVQRIAVDISLQDKQGKNVLPGMNATVRIHRN